MTPLNVSEVVDLWSSTFQHRHHSVTIVQLHPTHLYHPILRSHKCCFSEHSHRALFCIIPGHKSMSTYRPEKNDPNFRLTNFSFGWHVGPPIFFVGGHVDLHCLCRRQHGTICQPMISLPASTTINSAIADKPLNYMQCHGWSPKMRPSHTCYMPTSVVVK